MYKPAAAQLLFLQGVKNENFAQSQIRIQKKSLFEFQFYDHSAIYVRRSLCAIKNSLCEAVRFSGV